MATHSFSLLQPNPSFSPSLFPPFSFPAKNLFSLPILYTHTRRANLTLVSSAQPPPATSEVTTSTSVTVETASIEDHDNSTVFVIRARNRIGLLQVITRVFNVLGLRVEKATINFEGDYFIKTFFVTDSRGNKIDDRENLERIKKALIEAIDGDDDAAVSVASAGRGIVVRRPPLLGFGERKAKAERMFELMDDFLKNDPISLQKDILHHVEYTVARSRFSFDDFEAYQALAHSVRDRLIERWHDTQMHFKRKDPKRVYFLSLEFLMGRSLSNSVINLGIRDQYADALSQLGFEFEVLAEQEGDAALGNGGLARLSACQMDSLATLDYPAVGYGLRYQYGLFRQVILDGFQHEQPDYWLNFGNPWEIERVHVTYPVKFYGTVTEEFLQEEKCKVWVPGEVVEAVAYDNPIPGYETRNTINLRLWAAKPSDQHNMESYNTGDYIDAVVNRQRAENISSILYPDDRSYQGKELRLKQQYFFVSASVQDIIRRFKDTHSNFDDFPEKVALHLNDTHPSLAIAEVMRVLVDEEHLGWNRAWDIICKLFSFTTHTVSPEGLEKIPVDLLGSLLPRHLQIIYDINFNFVEELKKRIGLDYDRLARMSIVEEGAVKDFYELWPHKFQYKTNGATQRRWIVVSNPSLCALISKWLGTEAWVRDVDLLIGLREHAANLELHQEWKMVKKVNKIRLAEYIEAMSGLKVSLDAMFDVQTKRIHEYKRQLLNILGIIHRYDCIKNMDNKDRMKVVPRVCIIGGKAAPGYETAKKVIKLCHAVAEKINNDRDIGDLLKLVFIPDYNVSVAELVIPGADLSQHISTAGHEASGTGSMKFLMNGCLLLATEDGSTTEIMEEIGEDNIFLFGAKVHEVSALREKGSALRVPLQFSRVVRMVRDGYFGFKDYFKSLCDDIEGGNDYYILGADFTSYVEAQAVADKAFVDQERWTQMSILCTAGCFFFALASHHQQTDDHNLLIRELHDAKLKISRLESVLEETMQNINAKTLYLKEREKLLDEMAQKITNLQSALSNLEDDSFLADERLKSLEEEVRQLWAISRKNNFELHVLESKAQEAEDKLGVVTSQVEKMAEIVTEQWIQIQHLEQALQITKMRALQAQRERRMRCTFFKLIRDLSERHLPKMFGALDSYSFGKGSTIKYYMSQALQQVRRLWSAIKKYHHELQGFIKQEMRRTELTAALVNDELVFFLASALITFPILSAWMLLVSQFT
ncbi:Glycosyl transferase, family 35 [Corchorus olitorius]|uniref:Alpha-1,4 glucan phosphorylase n=1 Tax=Corchorus olitorius TaxID=93759 RepID=A0A1R3H4D3_9ROSI|nr:Glycosyl transferase, family 35 [Corchorus olitorius]